MTPLLRQLAQSAANGAEPSLFAETSPDVEPGAYYGPDGIMLGLSGDIKETKLALFAYDDAAGRRLFGELEAMASTRYEL